MQHSGAPGSCDGPRSWEFYDRFRWTGCPRRTLADPRILRWLDLRARTEGHLSLADASAATPLLLDVFRTLDSVEAARHRADLEKLNSERRG